MYYECEFRTDDEYYGNILWICFSNDDKLEFDEALKYSLLKINEINSMSDIDFKKEKNLYQYHKISKDLFYEKIELVIERIRDYPTNSNDLEFSNLDLNVFTVNDDDDIYVLQEDFDTLQIYIYGLEEIKYFSWIDPV